jgi:hypothetical protein
MDWLLANFPRVIYPLDSAMMFPRHPYSNLLRHLAGITHGAFYPSKITERKVSGGIRLQYLFNGKTHSYTFNTPYGLLDANFPEFFKHLTQENNLQGNFYPLPDDDAVIYLTEQQYTYAAAHKLLDLAKITTSK